MERRVLILLRIDAAHIFESASNLFELQCAVKCCGQVPKWPKGADCKSAGLCLPRFESLPAHHLSRFLSPAR